MTTVVPEIRSHIGRSQPRRDAREKLRGEAQFVGDLLVPRMLHGKVLRSPIAHGRIASIDTSAAERLPGVVCVLTGADLHDLDPYYGHSIKDRPILAIDKVRFHGEQVAAVAAETVAAAAAAVELIDVEYEELPVVADVAGAVADGAPLVTERESKPGLFHGLGEIPPRDGNVCYRYRIDRGELESVFARADIVVEGEYTFPSVYQYAMETHTVVAQVEGDEISLWATCQHPFLVRAEIADLFGVPVANVRIQVPYLGGGFGSKSYTKMEPLTVALARKAGRPVRIQNRVAESMVTTRRHNMTCRMRTAATADGRLLARDVECLFDTGAYADNGPRVVATAGDAAPGPYRWAAYRVDAACVYTNLAPAGSYRAFGATHLQWIGESQVDEVARRAGLDPLDLRRENLCAPGEEVRAGGKPLDADLVGDVEKVAAGVGWGEEKGPLVGRGVSVGLLAAGAHPVSSAICRLEADGRVVVLVSTTEMGQGPRTAFAQIAAEEIGVDPEQVTVRGADTRFSPYDRSTGASRSTTIAGLAVQRAAADIRAQLEAIAGTSRDRAGRPPRAHAQALRVRGRRADRPRRGRADRNGLVRGGPRLLGGLCRRRRDRGGSRYRRRHGAQDRDRGRRRPGDQPSAGRAAGRGRDAAGNRQRAVRGDDLRGRLAAQRHPARLPHPELRRPARRDDLRDRRERRRSWTVRREGLR